MYKFIVKQIVRRTFARLSAGDYEAVVKHVRAAVAIRVLR